MKKIVKILSLMFCITLFMMICGCVESTPSVNQYTVTFKDYDGTILREEIIQHGKNATTPEDPTREGYNFIGWDGEYINVIKNTVVVAQYEKIKEEIKKYTVTFKDYDGEVLKDEIVEEGYNATAPSNPEREGYIFIGWDKEYINITEDTIVTALYEIIQEEVKEYTVIFKDYDGEVLKEEVVEERQDATAPENPTRDHYNFIGWNIGYTNVQADLEVIAKYEPIIYTITFDSNGGNTVDNIEFSVENNNIMLSKPEKEGYKFIGWYDGDVLVTNFELRDYNLVARWEEITANTFDLYAENNRLYINLGRYPQTVVSDEGIISALSNITQENELGYIEYNGIEYKRVIANPYSSTYTFSNGNTIIEGNTYYFKVEPIKWRVLEENNGTYKLLSEIIIDYMNFYHINNEDRTINEQTIYPNNYEYSSVRAWLNGYNGTSYNVEDYTNKGFSDIAFTGEELEIINNTLVDNGKDSTFDGEENPYLCNDTNDKIYLLSYTEALNSNYGFFNDKDCCDVERLAMSSDYCIGMGLYMSASGGYIRNSYWGLRSTYKEYSFASFAVDNVGYLGLYYVNEPFIGIRPALTISLPNREENKIVFKDYNGNPLKIDYVKNGENAIAPKNPTKEGYLFLEWDKDFTNIQSDLEIYAKYTPNTYEVMLDVNGGDPITNNVINITYDSIFDITPIRDGYTFLGWFIGEEKIELGPWKIARKTSLKAEWLKEDEPANIIEFDDNSYVYFGKYPQTVVTDEAIINALSNITEENALGYLEYNGNEYKKVIVNIEDPNYRFKNGDDIVYGNTYYFLVEPIKWRILEENNGTYKLLCDMILDNAYFYCSEDDIRIINGQRIYPNNYEYSSVRAWLNGYDGSSYNVDNYTGIGFLDVVFTEDELEIINNTPIENSSDTADKIYLLSDVDALNINYGFSSSAYDENINRSAIVSDYSKSKGCLFNYFPLDYNYGYGWYWLNSLDNILYSSGNFAFVVSSSGNMNDYYIVTSPYVGIRPALTITIS